MITYKYMKNPYTNENADLVMRSDGVIIPFAEANTDYQEYLAWLAEGNTPEEAE